ncbi:hypothetical protein [Leifsonia sp. AG29]|uniref:hypothetical protein n=1 Tax=Leifsonia sp. AG29 TaxID=2598860 RepID=UPI00131B38AF|nr:hypothetical protein [Leifsonia sp. AG29]
MARYFVDFGGRRLVPREDIETTKRLIVEAAQAGGDFVRFASASGDVDALIMPGTRILIESMPDEEEPVAGASTIETAFPAVDDFDEFGI